MNQAKPLNPRRLKRKILHPFEVILARMIFFLFKALPIPLSVSLGGWAGTVAFSIFRLRRGVCLTNLGVAFPEWSDAEKIRIGRRSYANLGRSMAEVLILGKADRSYIESHVTMHGEQHAKTAMENGRGLLSVTGHFGSWELGAAALRQKDYPVDLLVGHQKNQKVDQLFNALRLRQGLGLIPLDQALRGILRALKKNRVVALLGDQDARRGAGVVVEFFGRPTSVHEGAALFSIKTGAPIVCPFICRKGTSSHHEVTLPPPLEYTPVGDRNQDIKALTQLHTLKLEEWIRAYPDHWFWGHKRWKSMGLYG